VIVRLTPTAWWQALSPPRRHSPEGVNWWLARWLCDPSEQPKPFVFTKSADVILSSTGRFASRTLAAHGTNNMQEIKDSVD
jgi:hypothetical protein